ncbi:hypothetical protein TNIN_367511 [Trichonephila inaurata madagascariensis]|uniref:Uncharacterized protein n=1 Tax=Trichonephila inaurata madagascariensis TaxID=2747483 RepID=A0A8X6YI37_9ARAC|nr:hypothetical protein TNIN_367511 [Trichonephila inaurata madagascariensis]
MCCQTENRNAALRSLLFVRMFRNFSSDTFLYIRNILAAKEMRFECQAFLPDLRESGFVRLKLRDENIYSDLIIYGRMIDKSSLGRELLGSFVEYL